MKIETIGSSIITTVTSPEGEIKLYEYPDTVSSGVIVRTSSLSSGLHLEMKHLEMITKTVERSRGLIKGGVKLSLKFPDFLGGFCFGFEKKPEKETKTTRKMILGMKDKR